MLRDFARNSPHPRFGRPLPKERRRAEALPRASRGLCCTWMCECRERMDAQKRRMHKDVRMSRGACDAQGGANAAGRRDAPERRGAGAGATPQGEAKSRSAHLCFARPLERRRAGAIPGRGESRLAADELGLLLRLTCRREPACLPVACLPRGLLATQLGLLFACGLPAARLTCRRSSACSFVFVRRSVFSLHRIAR